MIDILSADKRTGNTGLGTYIFILAYNIFHIILIRKETSISIIF